MHIITRTKLLRLVFYLLLFSFLVIWFYLVHPIQIFDTDDWLYAYHIRGAYPIWGDWNPTRVLPEVLMPIVSAFGQYIIFPLTQDFFGAFSLAYALTAAFAITFLFQNVELYLDKGGMSKGTVFFLLLCFLVSHFLALRFKESSNRYMLMTVNATCLFYYLIPDILCSAWVLWTEYTKLLKVRFNNTDMKQRGAYILLTYFCLFSNLWASAIMAAYLGASLTQTLITALHKKQFKLSYYIRNHVCELSILIVWVVVQVFELSGGRASSIAAGSFVQGLRRSLSTLYYAGFKCLNRSFLTGSVVIILAGIMLAFCGKKILQLEEILRWWVAEIFLGLYLVLTCARTGPEYLERPDVFYGLFFFCMMIVLVCLSEILLKSKMLKSALPLLLLIAAIEANTSGKTFFESNIAQLEPEVCTQVSEDILEQLISAGKERKTMTEIYVPVFQSKDNFPLAIYAGERFSDMLYTYGAIENHILVTEVVPSVEKNKEFGISMD